MNQNQFEKEINRLLRRVALLRQVASGDAKLRKVDVVGHWVPKYWISPHKRYIADKK